MTAMEKKEYQDCDVCYRNYVNGGKTGPRPDIGSVVARCPAPECSARQHLCRPHYATWVACSPDCRDAWQKEAAKGLPSEPLSAPANARTRKAKGYEEFQQKMF